MQFRREPYTRRDDLCECSVFDFLFKINYFFVLNLKFSSKTVNDQNIGDLLTSLLHRYSTAYKCLIDTYIQDTSIQFQYKNKVPTTSPFHENICIILRLTWENVEVVTSTKFNLKTQK